MALIWVEAIAELDSGMVTDSVKLVHFMAALASIVLTSKTLRMIDQLQYVMHAGVDIPMYYGTL